MTAFLLINTVHLSQDIRMKLKTIVVFLAPAIFFCLGCSKSPNSAPANTKTTPTGPVVIPQPLPNTIDKTDTLNVMAYNVLNYGDGCQGSLTTLDGYFKTIIQYAQPDLLSCEKMNTFPVQSGLPNNLADNI